MPSHKETNELPASSIARYTLVVVAILATTLFFWQIKEALLLVLAGVIVAVMISGMARGLRFILPLSRGWSIAGAGLEIVLIIALFILAFGSRIANEFEELTQKLPQQVYEIQQQIQDWPMSQYLLDGENQGQNQGNETSDEQSVSGGQNNEEQSNSGGQNEEESTQASNQESNQVEKAGGMLLQAGVTIIDMLATMLLVLVIGVFFAINPDVYKSVILLLVTKDRTNRVDEALEASGNALWKWLMGQLVAMAFVGIIVTVGLMIVGVPLALILGLIAGLFDFVPYIGPIAAVIPGILLAFSEGTDTVLWAGLVYLIAQQLEGYVITPLIQKNAVSIPPALVVLAVVAFGLVFGVPGIVLATPLAVITMVLVGMLYVQDVLGKNVEIPGQD
ncbi:MAG: AI-2E family transporter [Balneolales bacterium]